MRASASAPAGDPETLHLHCQFTGRVVCRCIYGTSARLAGGREQAPAGADGRASSQQRGVPAAAADFMAHARAAWRLLHHADASQNDPVVVMLPKLVRRGPPAPRRGAAGAAARLEAAEAAAHAAVRVAASMAAAAGLPYRPPEGLPLEGLEGIAQADHSELERQVQAVHRAQEARQAAAARAAAAAVAAAGGSLPEPTPSVMPLSAFVGADTGEAALSPGSRVRRSRSLEAATPGEAGQLQHAHSLPSPSTASGASGSLRPRRSAGRLPAKPSSRAGRAGPGKGGKGKQGAAAAARRAAADRPGAAAEPAPAPNLAPFFGEGYEPRGPSTVTPPKAWLLKAEDLSAALQGKLVQTFWPDGGRWWPAVVLNVSPLDRSSLFYETGDEESVDLLQLIQAGEVAWLQGPEGAVGGSGEGSRKRGTPAGDGSHAKQQRLVDGLYGTLDSPSAAAAAAEAPLLAMPFGNGISDDLLLSPSAGFEGAGEVQEQALGWRSQSGDGLLLPEGPEALLVDGGMPGGSESDAALLALAPPSSSLGGAFGSGSGSLRLGSLHGSGSGNLQLSSLRGSEPMLVDTAGEAGAQLQPFMHPPDQPVQVAAEAVPATLPAEQAGKPAAADGPVAAEEAVAEAGSEPVAADGPVAAEVPAGKPAAEAAGEPVAAVGPAAVAEQAAEAAGEPVAADGPAAAAEPAAAAGAAVEPGAAVETVAEPVSEPVGMSGAADQLAPGAKRAGDATGRPGAAEEPSAATELAAGEAAEPAAVPEEQLAAVPAAEPSAVEAPVLSVRPTEGVGQQREGLTELLEQGAAALSPAEEQREVAAPVLQQQPQAGLLPAALNHADAAPLAEPSIAKEQQAAEEAQPALGAALAQAEQPSTQQRQGAEAGPPPLHPGA